VRRRSSSAKGSAFYLKDREIRRWWENLAQGSRITADVRVRSLALFCRLTNTRPAGLARMAPKPLRNLLLDFVQAEQKLGKAGSSTATHLKAVKSWLAHNGVKVDLPIKVRGAQMAPTLVNERVPTPEELRAILKGTTPRNRVECALMAYSGVRPQVIGNYLGNDGLRIRDLPDLRVGKEQVSFAQSPALLVVRAELSKTRHGYLTFVGEEGCGYIREYLTDRLRAGESLGPEADLVHARNVGKQFVRALNVSDAVRSAFATGGFKGQRPYVLRSFFASQLLVAESQGKVAHAYTEFWLGHQGDITQRHYTLGRPQLAPGLVEDMREAYRRCEPLLSSYPQLNQVPTQAEVLKTILEVMGYSEQELKNMDPAKLSIPEVRELLQKKLGAASAADRVVQLGELPTYFGQGWQFVSALGAEQAVVRHAQPGGGV
jgi:site-specific recombinase XerD